MFIDSDFLFKFAASNNLKVGATLKILHRKNEEDNRTISN